jgi:hypothetical protein
MRRHSSFGVREVESEGLARLSRSETIVDSVRVSFFFPKQTKHVSY